MSRRAYENSHPWTRFEFDPTRAPPRLWTLLGQAVALSDRISAAVLPPEAAKRMYRTYLVKGARATTAIENNTLTEDQVGSILDGSLDLLPSQNYLGQEVDNILKAFSQIRDRIFAGDPPVFTAEWIRDANRKVLTGLEAHLGEGVVPGKIPTFSVGVGRYRGAPREDCGFLLERLCAWVEAPVKLPGFADDRSNRVAAAILRAVLAHLYIAWIHPFGDGNGRTARLAEFMLLSRGGVPFPSAHLLSNHYHLTRNEYYRQLERSHQANSGRGDVFGFAQYALLGFIDGMKRQCRYIDEEVHPLIMWQHYVYESFRRQRQTSAALRRQNIAIALSVKLEPVPKRYIPHITPEVARLYAGKTSKTLTRDLNWLVAKKLVTRGPDGYRAFTDRMKAFRPPSATTAPPGNASIPNEGGV